MKGEEIKQFSDLAEALERRVGELSPNVVPLVSSVNKAIPEVRVVLGPTCAGSASLASAGKRALTSTIELNDRLVGMLPKLEAAIQNCRAGNADIADTTYELDMAREAGRCQSAEDMRHVLLYERHHCLTRADWAFYTSIATLQVYALLDSFNGILLAYLGFRPGTRIDVQAMSKELAEKLAEKAKDFLTFPGFSNVRKLVAKLMESPAAKEAAKVRAAVGVDEKVHRFEEALVALSSAFDHADGIIEVCSRAVAESRAILEDESSKLLRALGRDEAPPEPPL